MSRRSDWWVLAVAGLAQLTAVLDSTVVTIALPATQSGLGLSDAARSWVVTAYALAFGGLLLIGGRVADRIGVRRAFVVGLAGFGLASSLAGAAPSGEWLFAGRALQGAFAALFAPAGLSIIGSTFTDRRRRGIAFGVYGALSGAGAVAGLLLGGLLTEYAGWRWCLLVNVPIIAVALVGAALVLPRTPGHHVRIDVLGASTSVLGMTALVWALSQLATRGPADPLVLGAVAVAVLVLAAFVLVGRRSAEPLLPFGILLDRARGSAFLAVGLPQMSLFGFYLVLTYWFQEILGYPPLRAGLAFLPLAVAIVLGATVLTAALQPRIGARALVVSALVVMAAGMALLIGLGAGSDAVFWIRLLPAQVLVGLGLGCSLSPATSIATAGVRPAEAGVAAAAVNAVTQLGGSIGTALLNAVAAAVAAGAVGAVGTAAGFSAAMVVATAVLVVAAVAVAAIMPGSSRTAVEPVTAAR